MAVRRELTNRLVAFADTGVGIVRIRTEDLVLLQRHLFRRYPNREWGTFFRFGYRQTAWGVVICFVEALWPQPGELDRQSDITKFEAEYSRRAFHASASADGLAIGVAHSHPVGYPTNPSLLDDDMDNYFAREFASFSGGRPYCSLIFERSAEARLSFSGRIRDRGQWFPVESLISVGREVRQYASQLRPARTVWQEAEAGREVTLRLRSLMGDASEVRLREATVGVLGCSGTGSPVIEVLARARVGNFVVVDPQRFAPSNLERMHGTVWSHVRAEPAYKVALMREMILAINPAAKVEAFVGNILHANVVDELVRCDLVLGCTDSVHGRVALDELARHFLVPVIDVGVRMDGKEGEVTEQLVAISEFGPELPCIFCRGKVNASDMNYELMSDEERAEREQDAKEAAGRGDRADQYWQARPRQVHTVGYLTTAAGAIISGYAIGTLTGAFEIPHAEMQFDIACRRFGFAAPPVVARRAGCECGRLVGWGDAANPFRNVGRPAHWSARAVRLAPVECQRRA